MFNINCSRRTANRRRQREVKSVLSKIRLTPNTVPAPVGEENSRRACTTSISYIRQYKINPADPETRSSSSLSKNSDSSSVISTTESEFESDSDLSKGRS